MGGEKPNIGSTGGTGGGGGGKSSGSVVLRGDGALAYPGQGGGGAFMPSYPTTRGGGISSGTPPRLIIEREPGAVRFNVSEEWSPGGRGGMTVDELIAYIRAWA